MSWRIIVISKRAKLETKLGYLNVRDENGILKVHLSEISTLIVESTAVSLTASLLCELSKRKIKVIFCDEKRNPQSELIPYYDGFDTSLKLKKQITWTDNIKSVVWRAIVSEKILMQAQTLDSAGKSQSEKLYGYINEVEPGDVTNREGHAAKVYFNALFGMDFSRQEDNCINSALNYGYSILLSAFNREIVALGYTTKLGVFHDNMFNQFNLSSDLMEPFRPLVDRKVLSMVMEKFDHQEKMNVLSVLNDEVLIDGKCQVVNNAIRIYCKSVTDALNEENVGLIRFYRNE